MSTPKLPTHSTFVIMVLLSACAAYQTPGVTPAQSRLASITTISGAVVMFDTLPAPQVIGDTIHGSQGGVPCAIPTSDVAAARWVAASGEQSATRATADRDRGAGVELATVGQSAHVRITAPSLGWNRKTQDLAGVRGDTLLIGRAPIFFFPRSPKPVPLSAVTSLEVSRNHGAHQNALNLAGLVGAVAGGFAGYGLSEGGAPCNSGLAGLGCGINRGFSQLGATMLGGLVGAGLGTLLGDALVPERWTPVALPRPRVGLVPLPRRRLGLGLSLAF
jgi:hypothetical protein